MKTKFAHTLKIGAITLGLIIALVFLINAFDRPLTPDVRAFVDRPLPTVPDDQNLFYALIGFVTISADPDENRNIGQIGSRMRRAWLEAKKNGGPINEFPRQPGDTVLTLVGDKNAACDLGVGAPASCIANTREKQVAATALLAANAEMLRRFHALSGYPRYVVDVPVSPVGPYFAWSPLFVAHQLAATEIALQSVCGERDAAIANLVADLQFWRAFLQPEHGFIIEKMLAAAGYQAALTLSGEVLRTQSLSPAEMATLAAAVTPLTPEALSMADTSRNEFDFFRSVIPDLAAAPAQVLFQSPDGKPDFAAKTTGWLARRFFQPNATLNRAYERMQERVSQYPESCSGVPAMSAGGKDLGFLDYLYNPLGNALVLAGAPDMRRYLETLCDLDGLNRIVMLQIAVHLQGLEAAAVPDFIKQSGSTTADPYTGKPIRFDPQHGLSFDIRDVRLKALLPWPI